MKKTFGQTTTMHAGNGDTRSASDPSRTTMLCKSDANGKSRGGGRSASHAIALALSLSLSLLCKTSAVINCGFYRSYLPVQNCPLCANRPRDTIGAERALYTAHSLGYSERNLPAVLAVVTARPLRGEKPASLYRTSHIYYSAIQLRVRHYGNSDLSFSVYLIAVRRTCTSKR